MRNSENPESHCSAIDMIYVRLHCLSCGLTVEECLGNIGF